MDRFRRTDKEGGVVVAIGYQSDNADLRAASDVEPDISVLGRRTLRPGTRGDRVHRLQHRLDELGYDPGPRDGIYGPLTFAAVRELQRHLGRRADGVADGRVLAALADPRLVHMRERLVVAEVHASVRSPAAVRLLGRYGARWTAVARATKTMQPMPG